MRAHTSPKCPDTDSIEHWHQHGRHVCTPTDIRSIFFFTLDPRHERLVQATNHISPARISDIARTYIRYRPHVYIRAGDQSDIRRRHAWLRRCRVTSGHIGQRRRTRRRLRPTLLHLCLSQRHAILLLCEDRIPDQELLSVELAEQGASRVVRRAARRERVTGVPRS